MLKNERFRKKQNGKSGILDNFVLDSIPLPINKTKKFHWPLAVSRKEGARPTPPPPRFPIPLACWGLSKARSDPPPEGWVMFSKFLGPRPSTLALQAQKGSILCPAFVGVYDETATFHSIHSF